MATIQTQTGPWQKALAANATGTWATTAHVAGTFPGIAPAFPLGTFDLGPPDGAPGGVGQNALVVQPYGVGNNNTTYSLRVIGWGLVGGSDPTTSLWVYRVLCELLCTLSASVGLAGRSPSNTERFADTLTKTTGSDNDLSINSPTGDAPGSFTVDLMGSQRYTVDFNMVDATSGNALIRSL